jgi:hypothetical protein
MATLGELKQQLRELQAQRMRSITLCAEILRQQIA